MTGQRPAPGDPHLPAPRNMSLSRTMTHAFNQFRAGMPVLIGQRADLRALGFLLLLGLLLWTLAYQVPPYLHLAVGGDSNTQRREDDAPFLVGVNASEPAQKGRFDWWNLDAGNSYRWVTRAAALELPGLGGRRWRMTLIASSGRPDGTPAISTWTTGAQTIPELVIMAAPRAYHILADTSAMGDLRLELQTQSYTATNDPRDLGFVLYDVRVAPLTTGPRLPAPAQFGWLTATLLLLYPLARWLGLALRPTLALALAYLLVTALLLATHRFALTLFTPTMAGLALGGWALALLLRIPYAVHQSLRSTRSALDTEALRRDRQYNAVVALLLLACAIRLGGMLHPHARFSDHRLNANNLLEVALGNIYIMEGLPADAGGGDAPYPPGVYLILAPLQLFAAPDIDSRVLLVQSGVALLDSLVLALLWMLLRQAGLGMRAALFGAAFYLAPAPLLVSFSIGEYANIGGQALLLPALALLAWSSARMPTVTPATTLTGDVEDLADEPRGYTRTRWWLPLLGVGLLGHLGVALSAGLLLVSAGGLGVVEWVRRWTPGRGGHFFRVGALMRGGILAIIVVGGLYYSAPRFAPFFAGRLAGNGASNGMPEMSPLPAISQIIGNTLARYQQLMPFLAITGLVGLAGWLLLLQMCRRRPAVRGLVALLTAWWFGTLVAVIGLPLLMGASQGIRWPHFLYPALCLGAGPVLAALWRRGLAGQLVAITILLTTLSYGLSVWISQIRDYLH
ncbi:MAG: hypothetical protein ACLFVO_18315 [Chloroflexaceae bacterium]